MIHIHKFKKWHDILIFNFGSTNYVLQGRKCQKCFKTKFHIVGAAGFANVPSCDILTIEKMDKANLWKENFEDL